MNYQKLTIIVSIGLILAFIILAISFVKFDKEGVACMSNPLDYEEQRLNTNNIDHTCVCEITDRSIHFDPEVINPSK